MKRITALGPRVKAPEFLAVAWLAVAISLSACGGDDSQGQSDGRAIDETRGLYKGVGLGSSRSEVTQALGQPVSSGGPTGTPAGKSPEEVDGSTSWHCPAKGARRGGAFPFPLRYDNAVYFLGRGRVCNLIVMEPGATTLAGVAVGDALEKAADQYPSLRCGTANEGTEYRAFRYCTGAARSGLYIWFGGDPINTIQLGAGKL